MNTISIIIGIACFVGMCIGLFPLLGWLNWAVAAGCVVGIIFGASSDQKAGLYINTAVLAVASLRLLLGGGVV